MSDWKDLSELELSLVCGGFSYLRDDPEGHDHDIEGVRPGRRFGRRRDGTGRRS